MNTSRLKLKASVAAILLALSPIVSADRNNAYQHRLGVSVSVPINGEGFQFKDAALQLVYQKANVRTGGRVNGYELMIGSALNRFDPMAFAAGFAGHRCAYGATGLGFAKGALAVPVILHGPYTQVGLMNAGEFGSPLMGASSLGCFDKYVPTQPAAPVAPPPPPSGAAAVTNTVINNLMLANAQQAQSFDWS